MVPLREILKNNINTILDRFSSYIENFPLEENENEILTNFVALLQHFEEAEYQRKTLSLRFEEYVRQNKRTNQYLQTPFLWFSVDFCTNANLILGVAKYHAEDFFGYLNTFLQKSFKLVHTGTSLSNSEAFEPIQYECNKLKVPLANAELQALNTLYSNITGIGYLALNPRRIKTIIQKHLHSTDLLRDINSFCKLLDLRFFLLFNHRAFDLEQLYVCFQLTEDTSFDEVIGFQNSTNGILCSSEILEVRDQPKTFLGLLVCPTQFCDQLEKYLQKCDRQQKIILHEMTHVTTTQLFFSLVLYQPNKGWFDPNTTQLRRLTQQLQTKNPQKTHEKSQLFFMTPSFKPIWHYQLYDQPLETIKLYCELPREFTYEDLPLNPSNKQTKFQFSPRQLTVFRELSRNQVLHTVFLSQRLWHDWGLEAYFVKLPSIPQSQVFKLLQWLPFSQLFSAKNNFYIYTRLRPKLVQWIQNNLNWTVFSVVQHHFPLKSRYEWFNTKTLQWQVPSVLKE